MTLAVLKHCGSWDTASSMFGIDPSPFQKMFGKFLALLETFLYQTFVIDGEKRHTMKKMTLSSNTFENFPCAWYATDLTFQQTNRPAGGFQQVKKYYSGKHHLHGFKVEVSVIPAGIAINCTNREPEATADVTIFCDNKEFHLGAMRKAPNELELNDSGPSAEQYKTDWAVLVDKGYQGLAREYMAIQPTKKARNSPPLSYDVLRENDRISHDRVVVENYFGRLKTVVVVVVVVVGGGVTRTSGNGTTRSTTCVKTVTAFSVMRNV
ncbi:hypothetical protein PPTG_07903 [Phytophthora nicotianae INRA-310]|uniref:DDE Tnp4 domain-containing protein n=1 Tax=Phytophthora nicotianae (strain INRA-310) TaxID=761204 RepID=W2QM78_PHYN3|nr:hypothetical protein PPTG_07903 [Phytophthora nicotianae INRA-310]ETN14272.1 hypothetical protein PPTG_07903 [Phytophthora nicotianae INRA-310]